jgi:hypothetical protein
MLNIYRIELIEMIFDFSKGNSFEIQIHAKSNHFGILFHSFKAISLNEFVIATKTGISLNFAKFGVSVTIFFEFWAFAFWTTLFSFLFLVKYWVAYSNLLSKLGGELDRKNVLTYSVPELMIRT